jgi:hypothetical protein
VFTSFAVQVNRRARDEIFVAKGGNFTDPCPGVVKEKEQSVIAPASGCGAVGVAQKRLDSRRIKVARG